MTAATNERLVLEADLLELRKVGGWLKDVIPPTVPDGYDSDDLVGRLELALQELTVNIVEHGYEFADGTLSLEFGHENRVGTIVIRDNGAPFDFDNAKRADLSVPQVNGYGLTIIETLVDHFDYERAENTNIWTVSFGLAQDESEAADRGN